MEDPIEARVRELEQTITRLSGLVASGDDQIKIEISNLQKEVDGLKEDLNEKVHVSRYVIVEKIVFGVVGLIVMTVFAALVSLVVQSGAGG